MKALLFAAVAFFTSSCAGVIPKHTSYTERDWVAGDEVEVSVGSKICAYEFGYYMAFSRDQSAQKNNIDAVRKELVFAGVQDSTLFILLREFRLTHPDGYLPNVVLSTPVFGHEFRFDLKESLVFTLRDIRCEVLSFTNQSLKVKMISETSDFHQANYDPLRPRSAKRMWTLYLKNGKTIRGEMVMFTRGYSVTLKTYDGKREFDWSEVDRLVDPDSKTQ